MAAGFPKAKVSVCACACVCVFWCLSQCFVSMYVRDHFCESKFFEIVKYEITGVNLSIFYGAI